MRIKFKTVTFAEGLFRKVVSLRYLWEDTPFKRVAVDIVRQIEPCSDRQSRFILSMIDYATRYLEALPNIETERMAEALGTMFSGVGIPSEMLIEHESKVTIEVMTKAEKLLSFQQLTSIPYRPSSKGPVERFHATLKQMLLTMHAERPTDWDKYLPAVRFCHKRGSAGVDKPLPRLNCCTDVTAKVRRRY